MMLHPNQELEPPANPARFSEYAQVSSKLSDVEAVMLRTKENVTLAELIASEGMKEMVKSLNADIDVLLEREQTIDGEIVKNSENLKLDSKHKKEILEFYKSRMKEYLNSLNVGVLSEDDYKSLERQIKKNALGSDLPRSLLAQYFAFLHTMKKFNEIVCCPMLIDSPFQQEQDETNKMAIFDFILSKRLEDQQMILATISIDEFERDKKIEDLKVHKLENKLSLLIPEQFESVKRDIEDMHMETLASA